MEISIRQIYGCTECVEIARELKEWFTDRGIERLSADVRAYETYGAYLDGKLVGFVVVKLDGRLAEILWMAVRREYQGRGIGTALLGFVERAAKSRGCSLILVKTSGDPEYEPYIRTRRFYERRGFVKALAIDEYPEWREPMALYVKCV
ncbi:MAG: GNAT family N-acetyltransferase [Thermoproteus sp.]